MKIHKYGTVILEHGQPVRVEGWNIEREPDVDPAEATDEQLLLGFAIHWAQDTLRGAVNSALLQVFRDRAARLAAESASAGQEPS